MRTKGILSDEEEQEAKFLNPPVVDPTDVRKRKKLPSDSETPLRRSKRLRPDSVGLNEQKEGKASSDPPDDNPPVDHEVCKVGRALTEDELQSAKYINEMMSHGVRNYATGWLLQDTSMTLWYADRMGLVQSTPFDIFKEPHLLLLVVAALACADRHKLGLCPLLTFPSATNKFRNYNGVKLDLPMAVDCDSNKLPKLQFSVVHGCAIQTDLGTIGRGTTVVPVKPTGTAVELFGTQRLVAKFAWPVITRHREDNFIRKIRRTLKEKKPEYLKHVVDLKCSHDRTMKQLQLPRALMDDLPILDRFETRALLCLVMEEYRPLESVKNIDEFKTVFVDVVKGKHTQTI